MDWDFDWISDSGGNPGMGYATCRVKLTYENIDQKIDLLLDWCKDVLKRTSGYK